MSFMSSWSRTDHAEFMVQLFIRFSIVLNDLCLLICLNLSSHTNEPIKPGPWWTEELRLHVFQLSFSSGLCHSSQSGRWDFIWPKLQCSHTSDFCNFFFFQQQGESWKFYFWIHSLCRFGSYCSATFSLISNTKWWWNVFYVQRDIKVCYLCP